MSHCCCVWQSVAVLRCPGQSVTFVDNHDTGSSQQHWPFPADRLGLGYAYILTHPGVPCLFAEHYWGRDQGGADTDLRDTIDALLKVRGGGTHCA